MKHRSTRWACAMPVVLKRKDNRAQGTIRSISTSGARLEGLRGAQVGDRITLHLRNTEMTARVSWADGRFCGVQFARLISEAEVSFIRQVPAGPSATGVVQRTPRKVHGFREL